MANSVTKSITLSFIIVILCNACECSTTEMKEKADREARDNAEKCVQLLLKLADHIVRGLGDHVRSAGFRQQLVNDSNRAFDCKVRFMRTVHDMNRTLEDLSIMERKCANTGYEHKECLDGCARYKSIFQHMSTEALVDYFDLRHHVEHDNEAVVAIKLQIMIDFIDYLRTNHVSEAFRALCTRYPFRLIADKLSE